MIVKDIAQYEENDSQLARHTIMELQEEIERLKTELQDTKEHLGEFLHEQEKENERLNNIINNDDVYGYIKHLEDLTTKKDNIINELEKHLQNEISNGRSEDNVWLMGCYDEDREILDKLQELKGEDKE